MMCRRSVLPSAIAFALLFAVPAVARQEMMTYQMVLFRSVPGRQPPAGDAASMQKAHLENLTRLNKARVNVLFGPFQDHPDDLEGLAILDVKDADAARAALADDPFVKGGFMTLDVKAWYGPRGWFGEPTEPHTPEPLIFGFLMRAASPPAIPAEEATKIQQGHLAYMDELHKQGKLLAAGPFGGTTDFRGIVIYRVPTVADAQALAANDPAVKAGRLRIDARRWMTFKGMLK
jgi:uncharacterized protein YciI